MGVGDDVDEVGVVEGGEPEAGLEHVYISRVAGAEDAVDVLDHGSDVGAAVPRQTLLDRRSVLPEVVDGFHDGGGRVVCGEGALQDVSLR
ncbi:hypothetical protein O1611_g6728 [Lasiodiplodia mahajangana]|uniref:Uncharacterized protein n=1 Tax=Lasiodiplodia mahajangana TaxID=1108764 RepID=A0ACC2JHK8_9PEZI|nr:hypothetical protein O1611_g6728 [Lasiodiplodia mahajangana]